ncbi:MULTISPECIES: hypothetical protein [Legionella]|uniref:Uncharacterized protein n=1 Tax=Legionella drozanskii LLAP-1 TaxID=1212489 RepID=A0A0W0SXU6_9GAMM|nr:MULTISPECIES: hypothetical protein [Legionella]KTC88077.1 hypothetical protein Ldro_1696 [Legionella drozanskii LLAP-1]PJE06755.1 MAG: hypothetical protein CK430_14755 [Legionella sp.]
MSVTEIFHLEYRVGSKIYILNKTELCCIDQAGKNNFSIALNEVDPSYSYGGFYSPIFLLFLAYIAFGLTVRSAQWFYGSPQFNFTGHIQFIFFPFILLLASYRLYRHNQEKCAYRFYSLRDNTVAFTLPIDKKDKEKTEVFLRAIVSRIHQVTPANEQVLFLLCKYGLLTPTESTQLEAYIQQDQSRMKSNVIPFAS